MYIEDNSQWSINNHITHDLHVVNELLEIWILAFHLLRAFLRI